VLAAGRPLQKRRKEPQSAGFSALFLLGCKAPGDWQLNNHSARPDRSQGAIAKRKKATDQARAANIRQGYTHDPVLEAANARYVAGEITSEEFRQQMQARFKRA
jgi:hypothetical protein